MNMQTKIRVRTANNNVMTGQHMTLTRVMNEPDEGRVFGFAVLDDGEEVYIPASLIKSQQMTTHDADSNAGFTAPTRSNPRAVADSATAKFVAIAPVKWDGEAEEVLIDVSDDVDNTLSAELVKLADAADDMMLVASNDIRAALVKIGQFDINGGVYVLTEVADKLEAFRIYIDECAPQDD